MAGLDLEDFFFKKFAYGAKGLHIAFVQVIQVIDVPPDGSSDLLERQSSLLYQGQGFKMLWL